jgi:putative ABC transport system permease protein
MALRNIFLSISRSILVVIGLAGCVALLICSFGIGDTIKNCLDLELGRLFKYDMTGNYAEADKDKIFGYLDDKKLEYEPHYLYIMTLQSDNIKDVNVFIYQKDSKFAAIDFSEGIAISRSTAQDLNIRKNDRVSLIFNGGKYDITIGQIIDSSITQGVFMSEDIFDHKSKNSSVWINLGPENAADADRIRDDLNLLGGAGSFMTAAEYREKIENYTSTISLIQTTMQIFSILLAIIVLYNISLLNYKERIRDMATLKVLGFKTRQIIFSVIFEMFVLVLIGGIIGTFFGYPLLVMVLNINKVTAIAFIYDLTFVSYLSSWLITLLTALAINLLFSVFIEKIRMTESLKSVE